MEKKKKKIEKGRGQENSGARERERGVPWGDGGKGTRRGARGREVRASSKWRGHRMEWRRSLIILLEN